MSPVGHGVDIVDIDSLINHAADDDWIARCFSVEEIQHFPDGPHRLSHIAGRFAAKEAVLKALGTGQGDGVAFSDVIVERASNGAPTVRLEKGAAAVAEAAGISRWLLSISHSASAAIASAIALRD